MSENFVVYKARPSRDRQKAYKARLKERGLVPRRVWLSDAEVKAALTRTGQPAAAAALRAAVILGTTTAPASDPTSAEARALAAVTRVLQAWEDRLTRVAAISKAGSDWTKQPRWEKAQNLLAELRAALAAKPPTGPG